MFDRSNLRNLYILADLLKYIEREDMVFLEHESEDDSCAPNIRGSMIVLIA